MLAAFNTHTNVPAELHEILGPNHYFEHNLIETAKDIRRCLNQGILRNFAKTTKNEKRYKKTFTKYLTLMSIDKKAIPYTWNYLYDMLQKNTIYFIKNSQN